ncbi:RNA polymerase sigma factor [Nocardia alni]|uniref:RNA polymerase sigma factor n=1 Tax=Nocardia alni TaxID=2815723 RepID=UPI001C244195|nr:sigma-70 family RNA polymerase sigma factor [Nocardia alni]
MAGRPESSGFTGARELRLVGGDTYPDWESIYRDNAVWLYALMFGKVGNRPDAEDLTAEVFTAALKPLRVSASVPEVRAYLRATARTVLAGYWRDRMGREITTIDEDFVADPPPEPQEADTEAARQLLEGLPERYRRILELRFLQGLSVRDAAAELDVSIANAKVLQHRALQLAAQRDAGGAR